MGVGAQAPVKASRFSRKGVADSRRVAEAVKAGAREKGRNQKNPRSPFSQVSFLPALGSLTPDGSKQIGPEP